VCVALAGCTSPPPPKLITSLYNAIDVHADAGTLTFETTTGHVVRMPADDPSQAVVLGDFGCDGLEVDATSAYFFGAKHDDSTCDLLSVPLAGGTPVVLADNIGPGLLAVGPTQIIVDNYVQLFSIPLAGGTPVKIGAEIPSTLAFDNLAIDGTSIYDTTHIRHERLEGSCEQRSFDGLVIASGDCPTNGHLAAHDGTMYITQGCIQDMSCSALYTFTPADQVQHEIAHSDSEFLWKPRVYGEHLYWGDGMRIIRASLAGGDQTVIAESSETVHDLAVDDTDVYFATDIALYRVPN